MLERQIMYKQMQELQKQRKLQGLNVTRQQNVINQISFTHNKQSSGLLNNGIPVRDPSQMFMFDRTNLVHGLSKQNQVLQSMSLASHFQGPSNKSADPLEQKILFDSSSGTENFGNMFEKTGDFPSLQNGSWSALMQSAVAEASNIDAGRQEEWSGIRCHSPIVPKSETDNAFTLSYSNSSRSSTSGLRLTPSGQTYMKNQSPLATRFYSGSRQPVFNSDSSRKTSNLVSVKKEDGQQWSTTLKQPDATPHNSSSRRVVIKKESVDDDYKLPQVTSLSELNFAYGNYKSQPIDRLVKRSSNQNTSVFKSKKRKFATFEHLSWHKEVAEGYSRLHDIRTTELEWAHSACRVPEQLKESSKEVTDSLWTVKRKRRLNLTTQLMQLLFRPAPATVLSKDVTQHCDSVTYYAAKLALADACSLCSKSAKTMISKSSSVQKLSKTVEELIDRSKRLEDEFSRLTGKGKLSISEVRMSFQDLVKVSIVNRFAKFHTRGSSSATDDAAAPSMQKLNPQRYVKAWLMPNTVPEEQYCISL